ncbi:MAG: acyclic terpene utilization AtuA family protein [Kiritimatiellae bacterium]|nr:acyclic terpene utilization AtuA family protein [Kiritimatiellia bacterium]
MNDEICYLSLCGMLGYGYASESLANAFRGQLDFIGVDAGSTDPGPYYLGSGKGFVKPLLVKRDLSLVLKPALDRKIPLIIGSAGGSGARPHVESVLAILREIARDQHLSFKVAVIYSDLDKSFITRAAADDRLQPCGGAGAFDVSRISDLCHPVAQFGTDPIINALDTGADVILAGRCCDTAIFAALPIQRGFPAGLALHAAKIAECGALCARPVGANDSLVVTLRHDGFIVEPPNPLRCCTPESVAAHSLYEQPDPECFYEPEGKIDMRSSVFTQVGERAVEVKGTVLVPTPKQTLKLEGARLCGFRAITLAGVRDPVAVASLDAIEKGVREVVAQNINGALKHGEYSLRFLRYGIDGVTGGNEPLPSSLPREACLVIEAVAPTQELADTVIGLARSSALHQAFPNRKATAGNLAFPFSPSDFQGGAVYQFSLYHLMNTEGMDISFPVELLTVGGG